jgi:hypothetical protein
LAERFRIQISDKLILLRRGPEIVRILFELHRKDKDEKRARLKKKQDELQAKALEQQMKSRRSRVVFPKYDD